MNQQYFDNEHKGWDCGGTIISDLGKYQKRDLLKTVVLAALGAVVSFGVTLLLKLLIKRFKK